MRLKQGDSLTVKLLQAFNRENGKRHLFVRVAYLQDERQLAQVSPEEFGIVQPEKRLPSAL